MSRYHGAVRRAVYTRLKAAAPLPLNASTYSSPPANVAPPVVLIGPIVSDEPLSKDSPAAFYTVHIETWVRTTSPADLDLLTDALCVLLDGAALTSATATLSPLQLIGEADTFHPDAPGGAVVARTQTFRLFAQS